MCRGRGTAHSCSAPSACSEHRPISRIPTKPAALRLAYSILRHKHRERSITSCSCCVSTGSWWGRNWSEGRDSVWPRQIVTTDSIGSRGTHGGRNPTPAMFYSHYEQTHQAGAPALFYVTSMMMEVKNEAQVFCGHPLGRQRTVGNYGYSVHTHVRSDPEPPALFTPVCLPGRSGEPRSNGGAVRPRRRILRRRPRCAGRVSHRRASQH